MGKICFIFLWVLIFICGGFAISEVLIGTGTVLGLIMIISSLLVVAYIIKLPVTITKD